MWIKLYNTVYDKMGASVMWWPHGFEGFDMSFDDDSRYFIDDIYIYILQYMKRKVLLKWKDRSQRHVMTSRVWELWYVIFFFFWYKDSRYFIDDIYIYILQYMKRKVLFIKKRKLKRKMPSYDGTLIYYLKIYTTST